MAIQTNHHVAPAKEFVNLLRTVWAGRARVSFTLREYLNTDMPC